jgi:hypothetical protein
LERPRRSRWFENFIAFQPQEKMHALTVRFAKKCISIHAYALQTTAMIEPRNSRCQSE